MPKDEVEEIVNMLVKQKGKYFKEYIDDIRNKKKLASIPLEELEKMEEGELKVKTGTVIDDIIDGGIPEGKSVLFYGEYRSGKTQTCFTMAVSCPNYVIYIDPEKSLRAKRLREMCEARDLKWEEVRPKIIYFRPKNWIEQMNVLRSLPAPSDIDGKIDLIICDSISKLFRGAEFLGLETLKVKNGLIRDFVLTLEQVADLHKAALVYTTQIYDKMSSGFAEAKSEMQKPVGGRSVEHQPDFVLFFKKSTGNVRIVEMVDSSYTPLAQRAFLINNKGIDNIPEDSEIMKRVEAYEEKFDKRQRQEEIKPKAKKKKTGESIEENESPEEEKEEEGSPA